MKRSFVFNGFRQPWFDGWVGLGALLVGWGLLVHGFHREWTLFVQYSYGWAMPMLTLFLVSERWPDRPAPRPGAMPFSIPLWCGMGLLTTLFFIVAEANPDWRLLHGIRAGAVLGFWLWVTLKLGGVGWVRHFAFPLGFSLLAMPWPGAAERWMVQGFSGVVATWTVELLNWTGAPAIRHGNVIEMATGFVGVNEACSGVRSFQATVMVALFLGELRRLSPGQRIGLLSGGIVLAFFGNVLRAYTLARVAASRGNEEMEMWHDPTGYVALGVVMTCVAVLAFRCKAPGRPIGSPPAPQRLSPSWKMNVGAFGIVLIVSALLVEGWYQFRSKPGTAQKAWQAQWPLTESGWKERSMEGAVRDILQFDTGSSGVWQVNAREHWNVFYVRWNPGRSAAQLARSHPPDLCLPASGRKLIQRAEPLVIQTEAGEIPLRVFEFEEVTGAKLWVYQCLWEDDTGPSQVSEEDLSLTWRSRLQAAWKGRRNAGQRLLLVALSGFPTLEQANAEIGETLPHWIKKN